MAQTTANVTISYADFTFPLGTQLPNNISVQLHGPTPQSQNVSVGATSAVFSGLQPGDYTVTAQTLDGNGQPLGNPVSTTFTLTGDAPVTVTFFLPASLSVVVS